MLSIRKNAIFLVYTAALLSTSSLAIAGSTEHRRAASCCDKSLSLSDRQVALKDEHESAVCSDEASKDVSWAAWLAGDSRSTQFHYLDLLELLFRNDEPAVAGEPSSYE